VTGGDLKRVRWGSLTFLVVRSSHDSEGADTKDEHHEADLEGAPLVLGEGREHSERLKSLVLAVVHYFG
jgi:hypothetical protein